MIDIPINHSVMLKKIAAKKAEENKTSHTADQMLVLAIEKLYIETFGERPKGGWFTNLTIPKKQEA